MHMRYQSRYHLSNGLLSLALDSLTGELLELVHEETGENLIKNHTYALPQPFAVVTKDRAHGLRPGDARAIAEYPRLRPEIELLPSAMGAAVTYRALWDGERPWDVAVRYTVELLPGKLESRWNITVQNHAVEQLEEVRFPCINGVYFGKTWEDDTLVYPFVSGVKVENPVSTFFKKAPKICWRWQNYRYVYALENMARQFEGDTFGIEESHSGNLSMKWLDYYGSGQGLYFGCHDPLPHICSLRADTLGPACPGMNFSFGHPICLKSEEKWSSPAFVLALHAGDWHAGAERYREFRRTASPASTACPDWFQKSPGLVAHYDFKYQNGGVVHRFNEIEGLLEEAEALGLNHLLLAGWHKDGFDNGFPEYEPDPELGTEEELRTQVQRVTARGGHICFYVNSRLANTKYSHLKKFIAENSVLRQDGSIFTEQYGTDDLRFAVQCPGSAGWMKKLEDTAAYVTGEIGIDGMYLDQLAMGSPCVCHNPKHKHSFGEWNTWYQKILEAIARNRAQAGKAPLSMIHEGVSDAYGPLVSGQLVSTFSYHHCGAFPQLYRYTFPEQILVDMLYPERNLAMRPVHVAMASREIMDRAFLLGMYYWVYDLAEDNTFSRDPKQYAYLKDMIALRRFWLEQFGQGRYMDQDRILEAGSGVQAACYALDDSLLVAACCDPALREAEIQVRAPEGCRATVYTAQSIPGGIPTRIVRGEENSAVLRFSGAPQALLHITGRL